MSCDKSFTKVDERFRQDINKGKYSLGDAILPTEYKKVIIESNQVTEEFLTKNSINSNTQKVNSKLDSTQLMKIFQKVIGKQDETVSEAKTKLEPLSHTRHLQV